MKVSIGIPVYKVEKYIERCAESLFAQTYSDIQYVFVDDCSPDSSEAIIESVLTRYHDRFPQTTIVHHDANKGLSAARNTALDHMSGDFMLWVDGDDWLDKDAVRQLVETQEKTTADVVLFDNYCVYSETSMKEERFPDYESAADCVVRTIERSCPFHIWGRFMRLSLYEGVRTLPGINVGEDVQVSAILMHKASTIINLHAPLYYYNCENSNAYRTKSGEGINIQAWTSFNHVKEYFLEKGSVYSDAVSHAELWCASCDLVNYVRSSCESHYYQSASKHIECVDRKYRKQFGIERRIMFDVYKVKPLLVVYVRFADRILGLTKKDKK